MKQKKMMEYAMLFSSVLEIFKCIVSKFVNTGDHRLDGFLIVLIITLITQFATIETYITILDYLNMEVNLKNSYVYDFISKKYKQKNWTCFAIKKSTIEEHFTNGKNH
jgi:hypothetical protein